MDNNNYTWQEAHSHLVLWWKAQVFTSTQMSTQNNFLQADHSIMVQSNLLGIRQVQKTVTFTVDFIFFSYLRHFLKGTGSAISTSRHLISICSWSKAKLPGYSPLASAAADARASSPQSAVSFWITMSMYLHRMTVAIHLKIMHLRGVASSAAICHLRSQVVAGGRLSKMSTSPGAQPILEIVTQWPQSVWRIWTNSAASISKLSLA